MFMELFINRFSSVDFQNHDLDVFEYQFDSFYDRDKIPRDVFSLDIVDLSYSTARTLCSYHLSKKELYFDVIASMLSHLNFIDSTHTNFLLSESRYKRLRDFSKSTRVGEMAQGINALFIGKRLNFPYIIDFDLAKEKTLTTLNIQTRGKTPDFVFLDITSTKLGLFESKGTMNGRVSGKTGYLSKAMEQIDNVYNPCFEYAAPVCTKFEDNNDVNLNLIPNDRKSSINYALSEIECTNPKDLKLLKKLHYASWFYLIGDFNRVDAILNENNVIPIQLENDPIYVLDTDTDKGNPIFWVREEYIFSLTPNEKKSFPTAYFSTGFWFENEYKIGIYQSVIEALYDINQDNIIFQLPESNINYLRKYPDGTLIYLRS